MRRKRKPKRKPEPVVWRGDVVALVIHGEDGDYLAPPVVFDDRGRLVLGAEFWEDVERSGVEVQHPVIRGATPEYLAELEQFLHGYCEQLGIEAHII
jgi:hypothetical protein